MIVVRAGFLCFVFLSFSASEFSKIVTAFWESLAYLATSRAAEARVCVCGHEGYREKERDGSSLGCYNSSKHGWLMDTGA